MWGANFSAGTLLRVPVTRSGAPLSDRSDVVPAAVNAANHIQVVHPHGTRTTVLTAADGLTSPTATALRGTPRTSPTPACRNPITHSCRARGSTPALRHPAGS
ncbi:hypothetical protein [Actinacidiphila sp. bgisy160]|uniref:hypothetical protein n=1 Tax=Actinacidiphila sp. bgisy160 TaxID=3413796 RepID=UPI003D73333A